MKSAIHVLAVLLLVPAPALASKAKFERTKPHVNVGTIAKQEPRILVHNAAAPPAMDETCQFAGRLVATDITPDSAPPSEEVAFVIENLMIPAGQSLAIPIPFDQLQPPISGILRREIDVEIQPDTHLPGFCALMIAAIGYDADDQATEYYIKSVNHRISPPFEHDPRSDPRSGDAPLFSLPVGFVGGNANQFARFIIDTRENVEAGARDGAPAVMCDLSGTLRAQTVPVWGGQYVLMEQEHSVEFQQGRAILDSDFSEYGASSETRMDLVAIYEFNVPLKLGTCANFPEFSIQIVDKLTGKTAAGASYACKPGTYCPQFFLR